MITKKELRTLLRKEALENIHHDFSAEDNASIEALLASPEYKKARTIFAFVPLPSEVNIRKFLDIAAREKQLALPKCMGEGIMEFCLAGVDWERELVRSTYNVEEPTCSLTMEPDKDSLILVPAMAFSKLKQRLGRGLGFYDRFLNRYHSVLTIGICRHYQLFDDIAVEQFDKNVDKVLVNGIFY
jgi:5-formyltetrahydrofolate cyclo-ligase